MKKNQLAQKDIDFVLNAMYWEKILNIVKSKKCSISLARRRFHESYKDKIKILKSDSPSAFQQTKDRIRTGISNFMSKIVNPDAVNKENWVRLTRIDDLAKNGTFRFGIDLSIHIKHSDSLNSLLLFPSSEYLALSVDQVLELPYSLNNFEKEDLLRQMSKDPFFGASCGLKLIELRETIERREQEAERKSKLPWVINFLGFAKCFILIRILNCHICQIIWW